MDYVGSSAAQNQKMLETLGLTSVQELFASIPKEWQQVAPAFDDGRAEQEALALFEALSEKNNFHKLDSYLGAGAYAHHIPALVTACLSRSEFLTAYTPYQAEASQGILQALFEFQSAIGALTEMEVSNASVYDGASACAEAVLMALRTHKERRAVVLHPSIHPHYRAVVELYLSGLNISIEERVSEKTACLLVQSPNFFGHIEPLEALLAEARAVDARFIVCANPLAYGLFPPVDADIAVGDCQPLGMGLHYGGPYAGYMACKRLWMRQLPGRVVSQTVDKEGKIGYVLTLQAREQHIRREKATSNICTSQNLCAIGALITLLWYGPEGMKKWALTNYQRAHYLRENLRTFPHLQIDKKPIFHEFVVQFSLPIEKVLAHFRAAGIEPGVPLKRFFPSMDRHLLVAVTELKTLLQLDRYLEVARDCV